MGPMFATVPARREITLRDCLRNTTGLATPDRAPYWFLTLYKDILPETGWDLMGTLDSPPKKGYLHRAEMFAQAYRLSPIPAPNFFITSATPLSGRSSKLITGKTLEEFYRERIFKPLGMSDTSFYLDKNKLSRFSCCYQPAMEKKPGGGKSTTKRKPARR